MIACAVVVVVEMVAVVVDVVVVTVVVNVVVVTVVVVVVAVSLATIASNFATLSSCVDVVFAPADSKAATRAMSAVLSAENRASI
jgi:hypothetical protein